MAGGTGFEPATPSLEATPPSLHKLFGANLCFTELEKDLEVFHDFLLIDRQKSKRTARDYCYLIRRLLKKVKVVSVESLRAYLKRLKENYSRDQYSVTLSAMKAYFRDYKGLPHLVSSFKFPRKIQKPKVIPSKEDLRRFYEALPTVRLKAYFLLTATSGLRKGEVLGLEVSDVVFKRRMLIPKNHIGATKYSWVAFYNEEAEKVLMLFRENLTCKQKASPKLIPIGSRDFKRGWKVAREKTGLKITSKMLRDWFAEEMGNLGMADRYIDAFQGRTPRTVLARNYTDYSPQKMKQRYEKANLRVFE